MSKRNKPAQKRLKKALIRRYGYVDMFDGKKYEKVTIHHIDHNPLNNSFENGALLSEENHRMVHKYNITDFRYWSYAKIMKAYKASH